MGADDWHIGEAISTRRLCGLIIEHTNRSEKHVSSFRRKVRVGVLGLKLLGKKKGLRIPSTIGEDHAQRRKSELQRTKVCQKQCQAMTWF